MALETGRVAQAVAHRTVDGHVRQPAQTGREQLYRDTAASIPAGRVGEVDDIAHAYLYCLTQPFATGSILTVDGGTVLA